MMLKAFVPYWILKRTLKTRRIIKSPAPDIDILNNILLHEYFFEKTHKWSDKVAVECIETKRKYTHFELRKTSLALAHFLKDSLKLEERSCMGISLPNLPEYPIIVLAGMQAGLEISPINPNYTQGEIKKQLIASNAKALFALADREGELRNVCDNLKIPFVALKHDKDASLSNGTINFEDCIAKNNRNFEGIHSTNVTSNDVALIPFSSGTTGLPKGVQLTHNNIIINLMQSAAKGFNCIREGETELAFLPFFHIYGFTIVLLHSLCVGVKLITFPKFTTELFLRGLRQYRPSFIASVPPVVHLINTSSNVNPEDFASLRTLLCGAAPLGESDTIRFQDVTKGKVNLLQAYGMTELSPLTTIQTDAFEGGIKIGGSGFLVPNTEAKIISTENSEDTEGLRVNQEGQLLIRGPQVMKGYLNNPEATRDMITDDGWLKTGDIGHYDEDGHIFITDRLKELIKVQGFQVAPAELEAVIRTHSAVRDVAVMGVKHKWLGEAPMAVVVRKGKVDVKAEDIQQFVAGQMEKHKQLLGGVVFVEEIPKSASGKILRRELKRLFG